MAALIKSQRQTTIDNMEQHTHLTPAQLADRLQVNVRTLEAWRYRRSGPPFVRVGRTVRYPINDLEKWLEAQKQ